MLIDFQKKNAIEASMVYLNTIGINHHHLLFSLDERNTEKIKCVKSEEDTNIHYCANYYWIN